jgi:hypothetical protein
LQREEELIKTALIVSKGYKLIMQGVECKEHGESDG